MQNKRLFTTEMDFSAVDKPPIFLGTVKQLDGVTLKITPLAEYNPMTMIGVTPKLYAKKPNGEFVYQDVDIDVDLSTSQMTIQCKNFMFSDVGTVEMEIELYDDDNYLRTSPTFEIDVTQKLNQLKMEDLKEGIHISLLEELMDYVAESKDYVERFKELLSEFGDDDTIMLENLIVVRMMLETLGSEVDRLENTIEQAQEYEFEMVNQETARVAAESLRFAAEEKRVQAETNRVNEEAKRRTTEQARVSAENTRVNNENTRKANEETRQSNEAKRVEAETQRQSRYNSFITDAEANANNFENYTNNAKVNEEERKANELDRKSQEDRRVSNEVERISNENTRKANEVAREKNETSRQNIFENKVDEVDEKIIEINATKDNFISSINTKVDNKISELNTTKDNFVSSVNTKIDNKISEIEVAKSDMTTTVSNKVNEVETRFNALTSSQQQSSEVIDARDGETSLKARLDRDIEKAKQVYVNVEGSHISTDSLSGYAKDVEILGNTIQDAENLADIRSVGDKVEGQELYEIPVISCGKNLFKMCKDNEIHRNSYNGIVEIQHNGFSLTDTRNGDMAGFVIKCKPNTEYVVTFNDVSSNKVQKFFRSYTEYPIDSNTNYNINIGTTNGSSMTFTTTSNCNYIFFGVYGGNGTSTIKDIQVEEGTQATPYEPYQEDKLTILSPVQLERVRDVADRIVCKDGVWGVEKNIKTVVFDGTTVHGNVSSSFPSDNSSMFYIVFTDVVTDSVLICDKFPNKNISHASNRNIEGVFTSINGSKNAFYFRIFNDKLSTQDINGFKQWLSENNVTIKYKTISPTFIPLPHSQQIKLRTFANKTNISFGCEIEGTIKAQVPKSIGATVNTHTEQINNLNKELDRVKKLEESTVSTVTTESDFTTVEATSNGYFEDVKLDGKTLVNLANMKGTFVRRATDNFTANSKVPLSRGLKANTTYTRIINVSKVNLGTNNQIRMYDAFVDVNGVYKQYPWLAITTTGVYVNTFTIGDTETLPEYQINPDVLAFKETGAELEIDRMVLLEGDPTQNPPSFFEGLKSVGQSATTSEDGAYEIVVSSVNENLFSFDKNKPIDLIEGYCQSIPIYSNDRVYFKGSSNNAGSLSDFRNGYINVNCGNFAFESNTSYKVSVKLDIVNNPLNANMIFAFPRATNQCNLTLNPKTNRYEGVISSTQYLSASENIKSRLEFRVAGLEGYVSEIMIQKYNGESATYIPHQSDKKRLLYYNNETQTWEKPILREWDSIEKHADGKYYYHQRSGEVVLNGSESWTNYDSLGACTPYLVEIPKINYNHAPISDKFVGSIFDGRDGEKICVGGSPHIIIQKANSTLSTQDVQGFKQWLQANNVTVVYQLAEEKVYECTNIDLITYNGETNYIVESGAIVPRTTLKVHNNISNVVSLLQKKVSLLESNVKASQEVQDMMILETDMRMLDIELALMEFMPMKLNLGSSDTLRSATYFNFLKNHIINETYEKEYLENVMNKYLATNRLTQEEYDKLYKLLYPPVYDIELPIEY